MAWPHIGIKHGFAMWRCLVRGIFSIVPLAWLPPPLQREWISSNVSEEDEPSLLVNGHFDSPLGSPGAADCGSCVASMLELSRLMLESGWIPPRPVIFLFNGAEELFLLLRAI
uniref:Endoplasmic reticulum metallopeptidase 1 n=1 Tax=Aegilops tauschii TaxID=37682 RepID=M8AUS0_AEGTA